MRRIVCLLSAMSLCVFLSPHDTQAYIGPGAGVTLIGFFLALIAALGAATWALVTWPLQSLIRKIKGTPDSTPEESAPEDSEKRP